MDLHVHTPGSADAKDEHFGNPEDIVAKALDVGLDAIAVTDHNTAEWCDRMAEAADGTALTVLPGMEISTTQGHLLAIWEAGTPTDTLNDVLARLGIGHADRGKLDIAATVGFGQAAKEINNAGGIAIAAHVDRPKGLLELTVAAEVNRLLRNPDLSAVEVYDLSVRADIDNKLGADRRMAYTQASDAFDKDKHSANGIGARRTWVKASRPDLVGLKHALNDPDLRIQLGDAPEPVEYARIETIEITGGFLNGQTIELAPDLNTLLGGTGAGKSLVLEAIRYALRQQVDRSAFPTIHDEVSSRLSEALGTGLVKLHVSAEGVKYTVERAYSADDSAPPQIHRHTDAGWVPLDLDPGELVQLSAFSQGEVLEHSREPVGRMALIDAALDLAQINERIATLEEDIVTNGQELLYTRRVASDLRAEAGTVNTLKSRVEELAKLFNSDTVKQRQVWAKEERALAKASIALDELAVVDTVVPKVEGVHELPANADVFKEASNVLTNLGTVVAAAEASINEEIARARVDLGEVVKRWGARKDAYEAKLDAELTKVEGGSSLRALKTQLDTMQAGLAAAVDAGERLEREVEPSIEKLEGKHQDLLTNLRDARRDRRNARRGRVDKLNEKTAGFVKLKVPSDGDTTAFRKALNVLKVGSHLREDVLDAVANNVHPFTFVNAMLGGNLVDVAKSSGVSTTNLAKLLANIDDRDLWSELLKAQVAERPDVLEIKFKRPDDGRYVPVESLAHGQRCTAILVMLLADGDNPILIDQPEDALHAPWIEEYLVNRLRDLRGTRQYIFATRSPGIVVSADAEQIITMQATAKGGRVEASGSLERHDLNMLALQHLEGGPVPFGRRTQKLSVSTST